MLKGWPDGSEAISSSSHFGRTDTLYGEFDERRASNLDVVLWNKGKKVRNWAALNELTTFRCRWCVWPTYL